jgi:nucleotide-binding universal stress UspA family protein
MAFDKILVPVDFSEHSSEATRTAIDVAKRYGGSVTFLHVYQPVTYVLPEGFVMYTATQLSDVLTEFDKLLEAEQRKAQQAGIDRVAGELVQGVPSTEIVRYAREKGFDLIAMGTHGRTGIKHAVMGSVAERVVRTATCPVLTIRLPK